MMKIIEVHFGAWMPPTIDYRKQRDGSAEVWLYNNIRQIVDDDENIDYVADGVFFKTNHSQEEVENQRDTYFAQETSETDLQQRLDTLSADYESLKAQLNTLLQGGDKT